MKGGIEEELLVSKQRILRSDEESPLKYIVLSEFPDVKTAYVVYWIPEQGEDIFHVLINAENLVEIEIARDDKASAPQCRILDLESYRRHLNKVRRRKLDIALRMSEIDMRP